MGCCTLSPSGYAGQAHSQVDGFFLASTLNVDFLIQVQLKAWVDMPTLLIAPPCVLLVDINTTDRYDSLMTKNPPPHSFKKNDTTSWEPVGKWYQSIVGEDGHYYHKHVILPALLQRMNLKETKDPRVLDLGCGPGVLARQLRGTAYTGIDLSSTLLRAAKDQDADRQHSYHLGDITKPLPIQETSFSHATIILALQNVEAPELAIQNAYKHLRAGGRLFIVLNHPCFRIPRQSSWGVDEVQKIQYRKIIRYFSSLKVPMQANPSKGSASITTWSFHHPLSAYSQWLYKSGFVIEQLDEWCSDKESTGKAAKMENRSRAEIPLFLCLIAKKI